MITISRAPWVNLPQLYHGGMCPAKFSSGQGGVKNIAMHLIVCWVSREDVANMFNITPFISWKQDKCTRTNKILEERKPGTVAIKDGLNAIVELFMVCHGVGVQLLTCKMMPACLPRWGAIVQQSIHGGFSTYCMYSTHEISMREHFMDGPYCPLQHTNFWIARRTLSVESHMYIIWFVYVDKA